MTRPRIVVTTNGPGELSGWARPFVRAVYRQAPDADVTIVFVPCPYATGREAAVAQSMFPDARVVDPRAYGRFLVNRAVPGMERGAGALQYLGGDLFHATTVARRLGLAPMTYKFTRRSYSQSFVRFYAIDAGNAAQLRRDKAPPERVRVVGNLVADAVLGSLTQAPQPPGVGRGVAILPGSRPNEIRYALPFFLAIARNLRRLRPSEDIGFVMSALGGIEMMRAALAAAPDPRMLGVGGALSDDGRSIAIDGERFPVDVGSDYARVARSQLVITIPGTKCIEAAVLGRPMLVVVPLNIPEKIAVNGLAAYLDLVPLVGKPLKSMIVRSLERRFRFVTQPNIDADRMVVPEMRGVLDPADVASEAGRMLDDPESLRRMGETLASLYRHDVGAADRMAAEAVAVAAEAAAPAAGVAL